MKKIYTKEENIQILKMSSLIDNLNSMGGEIKK